MDTNFYNETRALDRAISDFENDVVYRMKNSELETNYEFWKGKYDNWLENENCDEYEEIKKDTVMVYIEKNQELAFMVERFSCVDFLTERLVEEMWDRMEQESEKEL